MGRGRRRLRAPGQPLLPADGRGRPAPAAPRQRPPQDGESASASREQRPGASRVPPCPREPGTGARRDSISNAAPGTRRQRALLPARPSPAASGSAGKERRQTQRMLFRCFSKPSFPVTNKPARGTREEENPATTFPWQPHLPLPQMNGIITALETDPHGSRINPPKQRQGKWHLQDDASYQSTLAWEHWRVSPTAQHPNP